VEGTNRISLRPYTASDSEETARIFLEAVRETASRDYSRSQIEAWARVDPAAWALKRLGRPTWVAEVGGEPAGFADLELNGHLDMMFVLPRFQRQGVATALLNRILQAALEKGVTRVFTEASITARPFFERRGFAVIAEQTVPSRGEVFTNYRMEKRLA